MIKKVIIKKFKKFDDVTFELPGHVVIAGPNNAGKTTMLQAVAAWSLAFKQWKTLYDFNPRNGYAQKPIARQAFSAVPLRSFDFLWRGKSIDRNIEVEIQTTKGWSVAMEFRRDSTEQIYVRPKADVSPFSAQYDDLNVVFVPPMTGLNVEEPEYRPAKIEQLLGQAKPGEILRNLLLQAHNSQPSWDALQESIQRLFGYQLLPPDSTGPNIIAEYRAGHNGPKYDIASAGSGFQQVLMLLAFLNTREGSVLLLDEPDAHLHVILQDAIFGELRAVAARQSSQMIIATHSEEIINSVDPTSLCVMLDQPKLLATTDEKRALIKSLSILTQVDITIAEGAKGVLYTEDYTDLEVLKAWAKILNHPFNAVRPEDFLWKKLVVESRQGGSGVRASDHYDAIRLVKDNFPGLIMVDGDARPEIQTTDISGQGLQRLRWRRYEIESYLVHPATLERFIEKQLGAGSLSTAAREDLNKYLLKTFTADFVDNPLGDHPLVEAYLEKRKARTEVLPPILNAGGLPAFPYQRYHEIASVMLPEEIHPEIIEKLDAIVKALNL